MASPTDVIAANQNLSHVVQRYQYNETYQLKILALLVRYPQFIHRYGEVVRPEYFEYDDMRTVCRQVIDFFRKYAVVPTRDTFVAWIQDYEARYHLPPRVVEGLTGLIAAIFTCDMSDGDAVRDTAIEFAKRQALKTAVLNIVSSLEKFDQSYEKAQTEIQNALMVGQGLGSLGTEVYGTIPRLPQLVALDSPYAISRKIPTPFTGLNAARMGGLGPGELIVIIGSSGQGKSIFKSNFAALATEYAQGQWIAHATLELSEVDNHLRYGARILNMSMDDIIVNSPEFVDKCSRLANDKRIQVKWFPPGITTVGHIRSWVSALSAELGVTPCMLIVDYPDLMVPTKGETDSLYINNAKIYNEIIALINDYQMVGVVSSQLDRFHQNSNDARASHIANSIAKLYNADVVGTINQTEEDKQNGVGRIWWDKVRRGRSAFFSYYRIDYARCWVGEDAEVAGLVQQGRGTRNGAPTRESTPQASQQAAIATPFAPPPTL